MSGGRYMTGGQLTLYHLFNKTCVFLVSFEEAVKSAKRYTDIQVLEDYLELNHPDAETTSDGKIMFHCLQYIVKP